MQAAPLPATLAGPTREKTKKKKKKEQTLQRRHGPDRYLALNTDSPRSFRKQEQTDSTYSNGSNKGIWTSTIYAFLYNRCFSWPRALHFPRG